MEKKLSDIILPNYWDTLEDGIGPQLTHSRKLYLRGGRFSGKSYFAAHLIVLSLLALACSHKDRGTMAMLLSTKKIFKYT